jgi:hypothetical protein
LNDEDRDKDDGNVGRDIGKEGNNVDVDNVVSVPVRKVKLGVLKLLVEFHLEHIDSFSLNFKLVEKTTEQTAYLHRIHEDLNASADGHERGHLCHNTVFAERRGILGVGEVCYHTNHIVDEGSVDELGNDGFGHEGDDVVSLGLVLLPFSQLLANCRQDVVDNGGEDGHGEGEHVTQDELSRRLIGIGRRSVGELVILQT